MNVLSDLLPEALRAVDSAPRGHLSRGYREAIWATMGPRHSRDGKLRRTRLALLSARTAEPLWHFHLPFENFFARCLETAKQMMNDANESDAYDTADAVWASIRRWHDDEAVLIAAAAAAKTVVVAAYDEPFDADDIDLTRTEPDDFDLWDPAFFASWLHAGGHPLEPSDVNARREFWLWWLTQAVPATFEGSLDPPPFNPREGHR